MSQVSTRHRGEVAVADDDDDDGAAAAAACNAAAVSCCTRSSDAFVRAESHDEIRAKLLCLN